MKKSTKVASVKRADFTNPRALPFVGRREICDKVRSKLSAGSSVCLCGMQQVGKTRVAKRVMAEMKEFKDTLCVYVSLSDLASASVSHAEQLCSLVLCEFQMDEKLAAACRKTHIDLALPNPKPPMFRKILQLIHEQLKLKVVLFIDELTKYRTWGDEAAADLLNMLETLVENGPEIGVAICVVSQLSMEMIRLRTPANHGGLHTRLSANEFFIPPFSRDEVDELCSLSSVMAKSARDRLYAKTHGYAYIALPLIAEFDKRSDSQGGRISDADAGRIMDEVVKDRGAVVSDSVGEICAIYREHGFDPGKLDALHNSLRDDYEKMGLIAGKEFAFAESYKASASSTIPVASMPQGEKLKAVLDVCSGILSVDGNSLEKINSKELSLLCMVASGKSPIDCLEQLMALRKWYDKLASKSNVIPQWIAQFDDRITDGHRKFSKLDSVTDDITKVLSPLRGKHQFFRQIFPPHEIKRAVPSGSIALTNFDAVPDDLRKILGLPESTRKKSPKK